MHKALLLLTITTTVLTAGCSHVLGSDHARNHSSQPLLVQCTVTPQHIAFGETINIDLTVQNLTHRTVQVQMPNNIIYGFSIVDRDGQRVAMDGLGSFAGPTNVEFEARETVERTFQWTWDDETIRPGSYFVQSGLGSGGRQQPSLPIRIELW